MESIERVEPVFEVPKGVDRFAAENIRRSFVEYLPRKGTRLTQ